MAKFLYRGVTTSNKEVNGEIQANNRNEVISLLRKKKVRALSVRKKTSDFFSMSIGNTVKLVDIGRFTRQLAAMTSAGLPLVQCMDILANQTEN
ncbi:MAG: type II secretion system F family protein, partial [Chitinispirillia bacterium]